MPQRHLLHTLDTHQLGRMKLEQKVKKDISDNKVTVALTVDDEGQVTFMGVDSILDEVKELAKELANKLKEVHETRGDQQLKFSKYVIPTFPKLPLKLTSSDWDSDLARDTLRIFMNILGYKIKGLSYKKDSPRYTVPPGWPDCMDFGEFSGPSQAKVDEAKTILESLLIHHGYDPETHVDEDNNNEHEGRKKRKREERQKRKRQRKARTTSQENDNDDNDAPGTGVQDKERGAKRKVLVVRRKQDLSDSETDSDCDDEEISYDDESDLSLTEVLANDRLIMNADFGQVKNGSDFEDILPGDEVNQND